MTHYEVLEVSESASTEAIRDSYRRLVKKYHPDIYQGDIRFAEEKMKALNEAFDVLTDDSSRRLYDLTLKNQRNRSSIISNQYANTNYAKYSKYYNSRYRRNTLSSNIIWVVVVIVFVIIPILAYISSKNDYNDYSDYEKDENKIIYPVAEPASGTILSGGYYEYGSEITVSASPWKSCVIKLKTSSGVTRLSFYIRAGDTVTVGVPSEYLYVYFAYGKTWYGEDYYFGEDTTYSKDNKICNFVDYSWEYDLKKVDDGNVSEIQLDKDDFD